MTKHELVEIFRRQYGYEPEGDELEALLDEYHVEGEYETPHQQGRVYSFASKDYHSDNSASDLVREIKNIFNGLSGYAERSSQKMNSENGANEFTYMLLTFLCKSALYFLLKAAYQKGYDAVNL